MAKVIDFQGVQDTLSGHCRRLKLPAGRIYARMADGWSLERALTEPIVPRGMKRPVPTMAEASAEYDGREFASTAPVAVAEAEPEAPPPLSRPFVDRTPHPKLDVQPVRTVAALPRGTVAAVAEAAELLQFVVDLLEAPETLPLRRVALSQRCKGWLLRVRGGAA